ncbi:MAG: Cyanophycin synthetase [Candidatus Dichloromethanomonas elyunquensis]|nr:MAG: Cyanophycin synthetase [Candidatus Dichloromethanomonas elyunquensis]
MKILQVRAIEGANFFSYRSVIRGIIDISKWQGKTTKELGDFNKRLIKCLPTLAKHTCSRGREGGFIERLEEGTFPGHVLEHVAIELLTLAGEKTRYGKTRLLDEKRSEYEVIYQYECQEAALEAFYLAGEVLNQLFHGLVPEGKPLIDKLRNIRLKNLPGPSTKSILDACERRGIPVQRLGSGSLYQLGYGRFLRRIQAAVTNCTSSIGVDIAGDKQLTRKILSESGIPVPQGIEVYSEEEILRNFRHMKKSIVVKPCRGNQGKGVSLNLIRESDVLTAFRLAEVYDSKIIIEEYVKGNNYRVLVVGGKVVAAAKRIPPTVIGDGKSTIKELAEKENNHPHRGDGHENYLSRILLDSVVVMDLHRQGLSLSSVPSRGEKIMLRQSANLSTGSTATDVTSILHPDNRELAVYAAKIIGLDIAGVDLIVEDISKSYKDQDGKVIEVNAAPGLRMHLLPSFGQCRDIGEEIVKVLFPQGNGRIPVISVTGTNGKTTTVRLISNILQKQNLTVGMTSTEGIYINNQLLCKGDLSGPHSAQVVLRHPEVQVAVLETARGGILRAGLGYNYADVAIVTNVTEDHLGQYGIEDIEDLTKVKSLVAEAVQKHSYVVLNAEDTNVAGMSKRTKGRIIYFSTKLQNRKVCEHLAIGGTAVVVDKGRILICIGADSSFVCHLSRIPLTWGGKAQHNVQNVLAAVAGCFALGYSASQIRKAICGYGQQASDNLGRLEYYELGSIKVILDYGHNPSGIKETIKTLKQLKHRRLIGCVGLPGDRNDSTVQNLAREAAQGFDKIYIKEDKDLRGRQPGEIAKMIYDEAFKEGKKPEELKIVLGEEQAFLEALMEAGDNDIIVIFYEKAEPLRKMIADRFWFNMKEACGYNISLEV